MNYPYQITSRADYDNDYKDSVENPEAFWASVASNFYWRKQWDKVLEWNFEEPSIQWFGGGKLNMTENCLDRHLEFSGDAIAYIFEPNDPTETAVKYTYRELYHEVCRTANMLKSQGVKRGDRVCIYMGMIPQLSIAMLACARIGAIHSVIFGGFSARSIADRLEDAEANFIITCDGAFRGEKEVFLKNIVDDALELYPDVATVLVYERTFTPIQMKAGRDVYWKDAIIGMEEHCVAEEMEAEDLLFILYTSGSTGKPKGVVHSTAGYMVWATYTFVNVFQYEQGDVFFCTADIGWITGHSYIVYAPLCAGATTLMFEGIPTWPDAGRFWEVVDKHQVNILYTAPTAIRSLMSHGDHHFDEKNLSSLKVIGTVGEPINEEAWHWYNKNVGKGNCPVVDTWFQTENAGIMITNIAGVTDAIPSWATLPLPGVQPHIVDEKGNESIPNEQGVIAGNLCIKFPWPGILRTTYRNHQLCKENYFSTYPGNYFTGDGCLKDANGNIKITGRVDDVLNVSGHRLGTAEIENAINTHPGVVESAVVGIPHDIKGQSIFAFVICNDKNVEPKEIEATVANAIGALARPDKVLLVNGLPKTRSGKIMRRILRKIAEGKINEMGDTSTLIDPTVVDEIIAKNN